MKYSILLLVLLLTAPLAAFDLPSANRHRAGFFDMGMLAGQNALEESPPVEDGDERILEHWHSRGVGLSMLVTGSLVFPGGGIGLEVSIPAHQQLSVTLEAGLLGGVFYEGSHYDLGVRGYLDLSENFAFTLELGMKLGYGRVLGNVGGSPPPVKSLSVGGFCNPGLEVGSRHFRFVVEVALNGADTLETPYEVEFFCGFNVGFRAYFGA